MKARRQQRAPRPHLEPESTRVSIRLDCPRSCAYSLLLLLVALGGEVVEVRRVVEPTLWPQEDAR